MDIEKELTKQLQKSNTSPFLFIGSGFSRRYINLEKWDELLKNFAQKIDKKYAYYSTKSNGDLPSIASLLANDYSDAVWKIDDFKTFIEKHSEKFAHTEAPLKYAISEYLDSKVTDITLSTELREEIEILKTLNLDGIITTNWDKYIESLFPEYKVYIGQQELLFSNPQSICEIYKIHGSTDIPESLVLTKENYERFQEQNPYLAAKLITIFVEHPIVFIGYSLTDPNILHLLKSITKCLDSENLKKFQNNLIFIDYTTNKDIEPTIGPSYITIDGVPLPITIVTANDFRPIYKAISNVKRQIPASFVRIFKEQIYQVTLTTTPTKKLQGLIDLSKINEDKWPENIEAFLGVGVKTNQLGELGYGSISIIDIAKDILDMGESPLNPEGVLKNTMPILQGYLPKHKYLRAKDIVNQELFESSEYNNLELYDKASLSGRPNRRYYNNHYKGKTVEQIINSSELNVDKICQLIPCCKTSVSDCDMIKEFLINNFDHFLIEGNYKSDYRKLLCLYDLLKYGWQA